MFSDSIMALDPATFPPVLVEAVTYMNMTSGPDPRRDMRPLIQFWPNQRGRDVGREKKECRVKIFAGSFKGGQNRSDVKHSVEPSSVESCFSEQGSAHVI